MFWNIATRVVVLIVVCQVSGVRTCQPNTVINTDRQTADKCMADKSKGDLEISQLRRQVEDLRQQLSVFITTPVPTTPLVRGNCSGSAPIVIQRHSGASNFFNRTWSEMTNRVTQPPLTDAWYGLDALNDITRDGRYKLRIDLVAVNGTAYWAEYTTFRVGNNASKYELTVSGFSGNIYDAMNYHNGAQFTTKDHDNDFIPGVTARLFGGGWWYKDSFAAGLNSSPAHQFAWNTTEGYVYLQRDTMSLVCI